MRSLFVLLFVAIIKINNANRLDDVKSRSDYVIARESLRTFSKNEENEEILKSLQDDEAILRKTALVFVRQILSQGDILSDKQKETIDHLVAQDQLTCDACAVGVGLLQLMADNGVGEKLISAIAVQVCLAVHIEDKRVCELAVEEFRDMIFYIVFHLKPNQMCYWLLKNKCDKPNGFLEDWYIDPLPGPKPPYQPPKQPSPGKPTTKFLFFTDMHLDVFYKPGSSAVCGEPLCCRKNDPDPHDAADEAWQFGDYRNCDPPSWSVEGLLESSKGQDIDFIVFTGDIPAHDVWNQTSADQIDRIRRWTALLQKHFPNTPVYAASGNHESVPVNSYPPSSIYGQPGANITWLYDTLYESWKNWIPEKDLVTVMQGGFYTTLIRPGLRVVSLNNNYCSDDSWWLLVGKNAVDPQGQLKWFANVMQKAEDDGEKVLIIAHRPTDGCMTSWGYNYFTIVNRYENIIITQFFGHAHTDELRVYYDTEETSRVFTSALIGPAVSTYSDYNLGYRIYVMDGDYDGTTNALLDGESYFLNITEANLNGKQNWKLEYSFSKDYGMKNLSPTEFQSLVDRFSTDDDLFQQYHQHISKSRDLSYCDAGCKSSTIKGLKVRRPKMGATAN